jgi:SAM-dependent methyltransferase
MATLHEQFGSIDIYLFDQLLRGRIVPGMRLLDAGCGGGRNLVYLLQAGYEVFGADADAGSIAEVRRQAARLAPTLPESNFRVEPLESLTFPNEFADVVICSAVLHFSQNDRHFNAMLQGCWRVLRPGGMFFCRLASSIGLDGSAEALGGRRYRLPDRSERYLVDEPLLMSLTYELGGELLDPLKTTVVQGQRCMTTWVVRKHVAGPTPSGPDIR